MAECELKIYSIIMYSLINRTPHCISSTQCRSVSEGSLGEASQQPAGPQVLPFLIALHPL